MFRVGIPAFDQTNATHQTLALLAAKAEQAAAGVIIPENTPFAAARRHVVAHLDANGIKGSMEDVVRLILPTS